MTLGGVIVRVRALWTVTFVSALEFGCVAAPSPQTNPALIRRINQPAGREIVPGDYLVVRGIMANCSAWRGRVLNAKEVPTDGSVTLLTSVEISPIGMSPTGVRDTLLRAHAAAKPESEPPRLTVEVMTKLQFEAIGREAAISLLHLYHGDCPENPPDPPQWWHGDDFDLRTPGPSDDISPLLDRIAFVEGSAPWNP